jgi:hypothetical protein
MKRTGLRAGLKMASSAVRWFGHWRRAAPSVWRSQGPYACGLFTATILKHWWHVKRSDW